MSAVATPPMVEIPAPVSHPDEWSDAALAALPDAADLLAAIGDDKPTLPNQTDDR